MKDQEQTTSGVQPFRDWQKKRDWHLSLELIFQNPYSSADDISSSLAAI